MASSNSYQQILDEYPEYITKEQLYQICHISKKSAQNLLESGEIPCIDSGRKTHRFLIATADVVDYLQRRDSAPRPAADETAVEKIRAALALYPDVLSVAQVSELTGRRSSTVTKWCRLNYIENIYAGGKNHIPKASLADFLVSRWEEFQNIGEKEAVAVVENTSASGQISDLQLSVLQPFSRHPYKVRDDEAMQDMVESIKQYGVLSPAIARPMPDGGYELVSGHRRKRACELAGLETMPVIVRELDDDAAAILVVDSNLQREDLLPSERAFAYKLKLEALRHQGERSDLTSSQVGTKLRADEIIAEQDGSSRNQIQRYIRLTELIPQLLDMVDERKIAFNPAYELSFLTKDEQTTLLDAMDSEQATPSLSQAQRLKQFSQRGELDAAVMRAIMSEEKKEVERVTLKGDTLRKYFPASYTPKRMEETIIKLLEQWQKQQKRRREAER
jgi:ParB family chromosome partitioning protein